MSFLKVNHISNALDSLETAAQLIHRKDDFKWKWVAFAIHHALYSFAINAIADGNFEKVLCGKASGESLGYSGFLVGEFKGQFTTRDLIQTLTADGIEVPRAPSEIESLNNVLSGSILRSRFPRISLPKETEDLIKRESTLNSEERIQLNRLILEVAYPLKCPKKFSLISRLVNGRLISFPEAIERIQDDQWMGIYYPNQRRAVCISDEELRAVSWLTTKVRNELQHFVPKAWGIHIEGIVAGTRASIKIIEDLVLGTQNITSIEKEHCTRVLKAIAEIRAEIDSHAATS